MLNSKKHFFEIWINYLNIDSYDLDNLFSGLSKNHINSALTPGDITHTTKIIENAKVYNVEIQHWQMMMINSAQQYLKKHQDWFMLNRIGENSALKPPYVDYYHWMCPNNPQVVDHLKKLVRSYCQIDDIAAFHLDYIRYPDVILPKSCQKLYGLNQTSEEAQFDFCYCNHCRQKFQDLHGYDILSKKHPENDDLWQSFRWDSISNLVSQLNSICKSQKLPLTAAVFPTPDIARKLVRQNWATWDLDCFYPMMYHDFYEKDVNWLSSALNQCRSETDKPVKAGLFLSSYKSPSDLLKALDILVSEQVDGICFFDYCALDEEKLKLIGKFAERRNLC